MSLRKKPHDIISMEQLHAYVEQGKGSITGQYWFLEVGDDGYEGELGVSGTYLSVPAGDEVIDIAFMPLNSESIFPVITITEERLACAAVKVLSRKSL